MNYIGISSGFENAGISVVDDSGEILFAGYSERYTGNKNESIIAYRLIHDAMSYLTDDYECHYYERPWLNLLKQCLPQKKSWK